MVILVGWGWVCWFNRLVVVLLEVVIVGVEMVFVGFLVIILVVIGIF